MGWRQHGHGYDILFNGFGRLNCLRSRKMIRGTDCMQKDDLDGAQTVSQHLLTTPSCTKKDSGTRPFSLLCHGTAMAFITMIARWSVYDFQDNPEDET